MSDLALSVRDLHVRYGKVEIVHGIDLDLEPGRIVTVIGANGAGKSTLLNALMGSLPASGSVVGAVTYQGKRVDRWTVEQRVMAGLSLVPEKRELFSSMTVEDNLLLGSFRRYRTGERDYACEMDRVYAIFPRLKERRQQQAGTLSGGERQMLAIGRALMARPKVLMLDEPSLGLAPRIVREILKVIASLRESGVAILLIEQNARAALQVADDGYVLEIGEVVLKGSAADLAHNPRVIESYLGLDQVRRRNA